MTIVASKITGDLDRYKYGRPWQRSPHPGPCPNCKSMQIEDTSGYKPFKWRCRDCKFPWTTPYSTAIDLEAEFYNRALGIPYK